MKNVLLFAAVIALVSAPYAAAQTPGTGNIVGNELVFETGTAALDGLDKTIPVSSVLTMMISSGDGSLNGNPFITVASLAPNDSDPVNDVGAEIGIIGLDFNSLVTLINGIAPASGLIATYPGGATISPAGSIYGISIPCSFIGPISAYLQSATFDVTKPNGLAFSPAIEHKFGPAATNGPAGDDNSVNYGFQCIGSFDFYGATQSNVFVNSNGNLTFGSGDTDFNATEGEMLSDQPRIAPFWADLSPNIDGNITISEDNAAVTISYNAIPNFNAGAGNNLHSATVTLNATGDIDFAWTQVDSDGQTTIAGISPGGGLSLANTIDISGGGGASGVPLQAMYQIFDGNCGNEAVRLVGASGTFSPLLDAYNYTGIGGITPTEIVDSITPNSGAGLGGEPVQLSGGFFDIGGTYTVEFGAGNFATGVTVVDACTVDCTTPAGTGTVDVIVTNTGTANAVTLTGAFTFNATGVSLFSVSDDGSANAVLTAPITFYGVSYSDLFVNANGNVTFGSADSDFSPTAAEMLSDQPRIAGTWADMAPSTIAVTDIPASVTVAYTANHHDGSGPNAFSVVLDRATGSVTIAYGSNDSFNGVASAQTCIAGISAGGSLGINALGDLNGGTTLAAAATDALFESFSGGNFDLSSSSIVFTSTGGVGVGPYQVN